MTPEERIKLTNSLSLKDLEFILVTRVQDINIVIGSYDNQSRKLVYEDAIIPSIYYNGKSLQIVVGYKKEYEQNKI